MKKIRTIRNAVRELRESDPYCAITESNLRQLCKRGIIPCRMAGSRALVAIEDIVSYFDNACIADQRTPPVSAPVER